MNVAPVTNCQTCPQSTVKVSSQRNRSPVTARGPLPGVARAFSCSGYHHERSPLRARLPLGLFGEHVEAAPESYAEHVRSRDRDPWLGTRFGDLRGFVKPGAGENDRN